MVHNIIYYYIIQKIHRFRDDTKKKLKTVEKQSINNAIIL